MVFRLLHKEETVMSTTFLPSYSVGPDAYEEIGFVTKFYARPLPSWAAKRP